MKKNRIFLSFLLVLIMIGAMAFATACGDNNAGGSGVEDDGETIFTLRAGHSHPVEHPYHIAFLQMAENVYEQTNGRVIIDVHPNSTIGAERELLEGLTLGTVDLVVSSTAPAVGIVPGLGILDLPFLFNDRAAAVGVLESEIGDELLAQLGNAGIIGMSWGENGFRHITNSMHPIHSPDDLRGIKIRTQENRTHLAAFELLGAQPTAMAWTEALTALQQGAIDAQENPAIIIYQFGLFDMGQIYMSLTGHVYSVAFYLMSQDTYNRLPADLREIILAEGRLAGPHQRDLVAAMEQDSINGLRAQGMQIVENVNLEPFRTAITPIYDDFPNQDLLHRILDAQ